jgi:ABC-type multidrug transport system ATPase subunit
MLLTTHSMEEADVLCTRIGIITNGTLRCVGPQVRLKSLYGRGYHIYINCHKDRYFEKILLKEQKNSGKEFAED